MIIYLFSFIFGLFSSYKVLKYLENYHTGKKYTTKIVTIKQCPICLLESRHNFTRLECKHSFHKKCIFNWVNTQINLDQIPKCPLCRKEISYLVLV